MRSAIFRWMPLPRVSDITPLSGKACNHDCVLCRGSRSCRPRALGVLPAPSISLESDRTDTTCTRFKYPCPYHHPPCRCAVRRRTVPASKTLSAGVLLVLDYMAIQDVADVHCSDRILGSRLHWTVFLAPHEGILQNGGAVSAGRSGTHSDACHARPLSRRTKGRA